MGSFGFSQIFFASPPPPIRLRPRRGPTGTENFESPPHQKFREKTLPVLPENVIFTFFKTCWWYLEAHNTGTQKWSSIVQYCPSIWDLKYTSSVQKLVLVDFWNTDLQIFILRLI